MPDEMFPEDESTQVAEHDPEQQETVHVLDASAEELPLSDKKWFIIHTYSGFEQKVASSLKSRAEARTIRERCAHAGGHATLFRGGDKAAGVFHPLAPALARIHQRLKAEFDPHGVLNRGRLYPEF